MNGACLHIVWYSTQLPFLDSLIVEQIYSSFIQRLRNMVHHGLLLKISLIPAIESLTSLRHISCTVREESLVLLEDMGHLRNISMNRLVNQQICGHSQVWRVNSFSRETLLKGCFQARKHALRDMYELLSKYPPQWRGRWEAFSKSFKDNYTPRHRYIQTLCNPSALLSRINKMRFIKLGAPKIPS